MCEMGLISSLNPKVFADDLENFFLRSQISPNKDGWGLARYVETNGVMHACSPHCHLLTQAPHLASIPQKNSEKIRLLQLSKNAQDASEDQNCALCYRAPLPASIYLLHIRQMSKGAPNQKNTHPFQRKLFGRHWTFVHNGTVEYLGWQDPQSAFGNIQPEGNTDSEKVFCTLLHALELSQQRSKNELSIACILDVIRDTTLNICRQKNPASQVSGTLNYILTDGDYVFQFCNRENSLYRKVDSSRKIIKIFTHPMEDKLPGTWQHVELGALNLYRQGSLIHRSHRLLSAEEIVKGDAIGSDYAISS